MIKNDMLRKTLSAMLIVISMFAFLEFLGCTSQITETDTDTETELATVGTTESVVWLYFPDLAEKPHESIVLMGDDLDEAIRYLNGIELKETNGKPEEPLTEMYVAVDAVRGYTTTYLVDIDGQVWAYIDEDCFGVGVNQRGANAEPPKGE